MRNFPDVELRPCTARGRVQPGAPAFLATARVVEGDAAQPVKSAIRAKYGWQFALINALGSMQARFSKKQAADCGVVLQIQH